LGISEFDRLPDAFLSQFVVLAQAASFFPASPGSRAGAVEFDSRADEFWRNLPIF
jgi:hypothetical protein